MVFMEWDEHLSVGNLTLDNQHRQLIAIVNDMYHKFQECQTLEEESSLTGDFIAKLSQYAEAHFAAEEELLLSHGFPELPGHHQQHLNFIKDLHSLQSSHKSGEVALSFEMFTFARNWIATHIKQSDQRYVSYIKQAD